MKFSVVIPTYNEEQDIERTLDAVTALDYPDKEVIVVDDSTDSTPEIVRRYEARGARLIRPERRGGRCEARNRGILEAAGEIVVILNADVQPPRDFLRRILPYYQQGYDYVLVRSRITNTESLYARYVEAMATVDHEGDPSWMEWTEGFSCRRKVAIDAGLFPTGFPVPICAGEDGYFGVGLRRIGARKKIDFDIVVPHIAPATLSEYWQIRKGRGRGCPQVRIFLDRWPAWKVFVWAMLRVIKNLVMVVTLAPVTYVCWQAACHSPKGVRDVLPFMWARLVEQLAFHAGEWSSLREIVRLGGSGSKVCW